MSNLKQLQISSIYVCVLFVPSFFHDAMAVAQNYKHIELYNR